MRHRIFLTVLVFFALFCGVRGNAAAEDEQLSYPEQDLLFRPLLAYYKEPRFFMTLEKYKVKNPSEDNFTVASVGYGDLFALYKKKEPENGSGYQLGIGGGVFAQFNLDAPSDDLVNADYTVGIPFMYRAGRTELRFALYHQSSHLGDEYILSAPDVERVNLSYEAAQLFMAYSWDQWRPYWGYEYLVHKEPADLDRNSVHLGMEYYGTRPIIGSGRFVSGIHLTSHEEHQWNVDINAKAGLQFMRKGNNKTIMILLEGFRGNSPHGQFYNLEVQFFGIGIYFLS